MRFHQWEYIDADKNDYQNTVSKTERMAIDGGHIYRTVVTHFPSEEKGAQSSSVSMVFVPGRHGYS